MKEICQLEKDFDFDYWVALARSDPKTFDLHRQEFIRAQIGRFPRESHERLTRFQWRLDAERRPSSALGACIRVSGKMWDAFSRLDRMLNHLRSDMSALDAVKLKRSDGLAEVIMFPEKRR